jgi:hypothetical protein
MIQRIQSIYLLSAIAFILICFFTTLGQINEATIGLYRLIDGHGQTLDAPSYFVYIPLTLVIGLNAWALIAYKNRLRQMSIVRFTFILLALVFSLSTLTIMSAKDVVGSETFVPGMAFLSPFFAFVCNFLALKAIRKDDDLVRSVNRIR